MTDADCIFSKYFDINTRNDFFLNLARPWTYLFLEINKTRFKNFYFCSLENDLVQIIRRYKFSKLEKMTFEAQCFA